MRREEEFKSKLAALLKEYDVSIHIDTDYSGLPRGLAFCSPYSGEFSLKVDIAFLLLGDYFDHEDIFWR